MTIIEGPQEVVPELFGKPIQWGITETSLPIVFEPWSKAPGQLISGAPAKEAFGLPVVYVAVRFSKSYTPIREFAYGISDFYRVDDVVYLGGVLDRLIQLLGPVTYRNGSFDPVGKSGCIARWDRDGYEAYLISDNQPCASQCDKRVSGSSVARLIFRRTKFAGLLGNMLDPISQLEAELADVSDIELIEVIELEEYGHLYKDIDIKDPNERADRWIRDSRLFNTPTALQEAHGAGKLLVWRHPDKDGIIVSLDGSSNILRHAGNEESFAWYSMKPAKGPGNEFLTLGEISFNVNYAEPWVPGFMDRMAELLETPYHYDTGADY